MTFDVASVMTRDVIVAAPTDPVSAVARVLSLHAISAVPVCDAHGHLLGIISEGDLLRPFGERHSLKRDWWLGLLAEGSTLAPEFLDYIRSAQHPAQDLMTTTVITAAENTELSEAADLMLMHKIKRLPVIRDGRVVGIVSRADLVRGLLGQTRA